MLNEFEEDMVIFDRLPKKIYRVNGTNDEKYRGSTYRGVSRNGQ